MVWAKFLVLGLGLLGCELIWLDPAIAALLVPQLLPGRLRLGIEPNHGVIVGEGLFLEALLIAPLGEFPLGLGFIRRGCPALQVLLQHRLSLGIARELGFDVFRLLPLIAMGHQPQQTQGGGIAGVDQGGEHQVLDPFGRESVRLAP